MPPLLIFSVSKSAPTVHAHAVVAKPVVKHVAPAVHSYAHADPIGKKNTPKIMRTIAREPLSLARSADRGLTAGGKEADGKGGGREQHSSGKSY